MKAKPGARSVEDSVPHPLGRLPCVFLTPLRGSAESACCSPWTVDPQLADRVAAPLQHWRVLFDDPPAISNRGLRRCIQSRPASAHWPQSGQHQTSPPILDINAAGDDPRRAIRASKHTPYMTPPSRVSHRRHGQRGRPQLSFPSPPGRKHENRIGNEKIFRYGEPKGEK